MEFQNENMFRPSEAETQGIKVESKEQKIEKAFSSINEAFGRLDQKI